MMALAVYYIEYLGMQVPAGGVTRYPALHSFGHIDLTAQGYQSEYYA